MKQHWNVVYGVCLLYHVRTKCCFRNMPYVNETNKAIQVISKISKEIGHNLHSNVLHLSGSCVFTEEGGEVWLLRRKKCICLEPNTVCVLSSLLSTDFFFFSKSISCFSCKKRRCLSASGTVPAVGQLFSGQKYNLQLVNSV